MGELKDLVIKEIIEEINLSYFLPANDLMSEAEETNIIQLFDSILKGYPISPLLLWSLNKTDLKNSLKIQESPGKVNLQTFLERYFKKYGNNIMINIEQVESSDLHFVLDGHQILNSLYFGLTGKMPNIQRHPIEYPNSTFEKRLFINLKHRPAINTQKDNYEFAYFKHDEIIDSEDAFWFKVGHILEMGSIISYVREHRLSEIESENLEKLKEMFCIQKRISCFEENSRDIERALNILDLKTKKNI
jgi:hypothetical protein